MDAVLNIFILEVLYECYECCPVKLCHCQSIKLTKLHLAIDVFNWKDKCLSQKVSKFLFIGAENNIYNAILPLILINVHYNS